MGQEHGSSVLLAVEVEPSQVANYSVFDVQATDDDRVKKVVGMAEKSAVEDAPSNLLAAGRYLLDRAIFGALRRITLGRGGELQLTETIELFISEGHSFLVVVGIGIRHDSAILSAFPASVDFRLCHLKRDSGLFSESKALM